MKELNSAQNHESLLKRYRLNESEYKLIESILGRPPQGVEWALFSALWSEHCSYKSSKVHLRKFSYKNKSVLEGEGENAGVIDLGQNERIAFKMESHNHPSFIEPFQGAATGVGGILRDIFTMGARPIAIADYLCFGDPEAPRMKTLLKGVVHGISAYGNCVGVPTITGQTEIESGYDKNILVNAMAVGLFTGGMKMAKSQVQGPGNLLVYVGAKTGKDGVHGASMASEAFGQDSESKKPNVQIGDPFFEKLLIEACLEIIEQNLVVAMQDMGAAGLTSSSFEMSAKGGLGLTVDLSKVPLRDSSMTPEEILLSESQERMLLVCEPQKLDAVRKVFSHWGLDAVAIGHVRTEPEIQLFWHGEKICEIDPTKIVEQAPRYERNYNLENKDESQFKLDFGPQTTSQRVSGMLENIRFSPRKWITKQYDQRVGLRTARDASQSVSFQRLPSGRGLAMAVGCRPKLMKISARLGALDAVFYPAFQMAIKGAKALAVTDCLNFGNPEKVAVMSDFVTSVETIAECAKKLDAPVISGNVSFYNETMGKNIIPTPATGLVGLRESVEGIPWDQFQKEDLTVFWIKYQSAMADFEKVNWSGKISIDEWALFIGWILKGSSDFSSSKAIGEGGLLKTLWQMSRGGVGFIDNMKHNFSSEDLSGVPFYSAIVAVSKSNLSSFQSWIKEAPAGVVLKEIGTTKLQKFKIEKTELSINEGIHKEDTYWLKTWGLS